MNIRHTINKVAASICGTIHIIKSILSAHNVNKFTTYLNLLVRIPKTSSIVHRTIFFIVNTLLDPEEYIKGAFDINIKHSNGRQPISIHIINNMKNMYLKGTGKYPHLYNIHFTRNDTNLTPVKDT